MTNEELPSRSAILLPSPLQVQDTAHTHLQVGDCMQIPRRSLVLVQSSNGLVRVLQRDANLAGSQKVLRHDSFTVFNISLPPSLLPLYNVQCIYPVWPFFSSNLKLATNQICFGFSLWGEIYLFGLHYVVWIAFEAVLFDADQLFLQSLPLGKGKTWFWLMTKKHIAKAYASITSMEHDNRYGPGALLVVLVVQVWH